MKKPILLFACAISAGCATYSYEGRGLIAGQSTYEDVTHVMGPPAMQWTEVSGSRQLSYPRGPAGVHTYMVRIGSDGKLQGINNVMDMPFFAEIKEGMSVDDVTKVLGPSVSHWTEYFNRRDELVLGWRYCDDWNQLARFFVLFDNTRKTVRSTIMLRENQIEQCGEGAGCWCSK